MLQRGRTKRLVLIILAGALFGLSAGVPAFAWTSTLTTTIQCYNTKTGFTNCVTVCSWTGTGTGTGCSGSSGSGTPTITGGTTIRDKATLTLSLVCEINGVTEYDGSCKGSYKLTCVAYTPTANCGTISFYLVTGSPPATCPKTKPSGATAEGSSTVPTSNDGATGYYYSSSLVVTGSGQHYFWVVYSGTPANKGLEGYPAQYACEPYKTTTSAPQFPLGMALVIALALPGLLLIRSRFKAFPLSLPTQ